MDQGRRVLDPLVWRHVCGIGVNQEAAACWVPVGATSRDGPVRGSRMRAEPLSYRLCYHRLMARRDKRSVSLPPELAAAIDQAAAAEGSTFSAWLAETAAHRLRLEAGRSGLAAWEKEHGPLTAQELSEGLARARAALGRRSERTSPRSA